jgi:hypothetical protein
VYVGKFRGIWDGILEGGVDGEEWRRVSVEVVAMCWAC